MLDHSKVKLIGGVNIVILSSYLIALVIFPFPVSAESLYFLLLGWIQLFIFNILVAFIFTYEKAKEHAPGWDVYFIEQEWRDWLTEPPRNPDAAFLGFCKKWCKKRGPAR